MQVVEAVNLPVTTVEHIEVHIEDEKGKRVELRARYSVADPDNNPTRRRLADAIVGRRGSKESLSRFGMAAAVSAADEFDRIEHPTISHRKHFAGCLVAAKMSRDEAETLAGIPEYFEKLERQNATN